MIAGPFKGRRVQDCKALCRDLLVEQGKAFLYAEPEAPIMSRSGSDCVVALAEQWYLDYACADWKARALEALKGVDTFSDELRNQFNHVIEWLRQWAVSRTFGLGTKIPWDERFIVESLSDSTVYNAYYTVAPWLGGGDLFQAVGVDSRQIIPTDLVDDALFDYVFDCSEEIPPQFNDAGR